MSVPFLETMFCNQLKHVATQRYLIIHIFFSRSFGIVLWEIWSRKVPYNEDSVVSIIDFKDSVIAGRRPIINKVWPKGQISLMKQCWEAEPTARPTFSEVVSILESEKDLCVY